MTFVNNSLLDAALDLLTPANRLDICTLEPETFIEATTTFSLGNKLGVSVSVPANRGAGGRQVVVAAFTAGTVTTGGTAAFWGLSNTATSTLLVAGPLVSNKVLSVGIDFDFAEMVIAAEGILG